VNQGKKVLLKIGGRPEKKIENKKKGRRKRAIEWTKARQRAKCTSYSAKVPRSVSKKDSAEGSLEREENSGRDSTEP